MHDALGVQACLDESSHGGAVANPVANVMVGVEGDESRGFEVGPECAEGGGIGDRVVATECHDQFGSCGELSDLGNRDCLVLVWVFDVAGVDGADRFD